MDADLETPVSAFLKLTQRPKASGAANATTQDSQQQNGTHASVNSPSDDSCFLLESIEGGEFQARYSFIGRRPYKLLEQRGCDPLLAIEQELSNYRVFPVPELPSFTGGGCGYLSYDCVHYFERNGVIPLAARDVLQLPESIFMFCRTLTIFDHVKHSIHCVTHLFLPASLDRHNVQQLRSVYNHAIGELQSSLEALCSPLPAQHAPHTRQAQKLHSDGRLSPALDDHTVDSEHLQSPQQHKQKQEISSDAAASEQLPAKGKSMLESNVGQSGYECFVRSLQQHIGCGDIIQAVPSQRCRRPLQHQTTALDVYRQLRRINPSPYMFYLDFPQHDFQVVGASPECLVKVDAARRVTTHPIAGTRRRGATPEADLALERELLADTKERAEHIMLVDLGRNDVGRVSVAGSVKVDRLMTIERYSHVMHIVSHVSGLLQPELSIYDALRSVFPAGTVSGAPKIRAMQLISQLECERRGVYAGAVGLISFGGVLDSAIAIRTMVVRPSEAAAYLQSGGGIVYDSQPAAEYEETVNKMAALAAAIDQAEEHKLKQQQQQQRNSQQQLPVQQELLNQIQQLTQQLQSAPSVEGDSAKQQQIGQMLALAQSMCS